MGTRRCATATAAAAPTTTTTTTTTATATATTEQHEKLPYQLSSHPGYMEDLLGSDKDEKGLYGCFPFVSTTAVVDEAVGGHSHF